MASIYTQTQNGHGNFQRKLFFYKKQDGHENFSYILRQVSAAGVAGFPVRLLPKGAVIIFFFKISHACAGGRWRITWGSTIGEKKMLAVQIETRHICFIDVPFLTKRQSKRLYSFKFSITAPVPGNA